MPRAHGQSSRPAAGSGDAMPLLERFEDLVDDLLAEPGVTPPGGGGFGRSAVRWDGRIFAMFVRGQLVLKLPAKRVDDLVGRGEGDRFDANKGTPMREWLSLDAASSEPWLPLAREALAFAKSKPERKPRRRTPGSQSGR